MTGSPEQNKLDSEILNLLKTNPKAGFTRLFDSYFEEVCRHIFRYIPDTRTAKDVAQDLFVELWTKRDKLDISSSPGAYLYRMAVSRAINHIRDNKKHRHSDVSEIRSVSTPYPAPDQIMEAESMRLVITEAIDSLPDRCREVFVLSRFEQMSNGQIAESLEISVKTVENQMTKALKALRLTIEKYKGSA